MRPWPLRIREDGAVRWLLGGVCILALCSCRPTPTPVPDPELLAKVGGLEIRAADFQESMRRRAVADDPLKKRALLEELIDRAALVERAKSLGLDRDPELRRSWENLLVSKLRQKELEPSLGTNGATEELVQAEYEANQASFTEPAMRRGAILFLETPPKATDSAIARLGERMLEAQRKAREQLTREPGVRGFGSLAVEYSEDQTTRYRGGDLGWIQQGRPDARLDAAVTDVLFSLSTNQALSDPVRTSRGIWLVKLLETRPQKLKPLGAVRPALEQKISGRNRQRAEEEFKTKARSQVRVEVFTNALDLVRSVQPQDPVSTEPPGVP